jgi:hypothetical protein
MGRAYGEWKRMVRSCYSPQDRDYKNVGAKGVRIHLPWRVSFENFLIDIGEPPLNAVLRRHDESQDFRPDNCYWAGGQS